MRAIIFALALATPMAGMASTLGEERNMDVTALNATDFEVFDGPRMGPTEFWCAAGSFNEDRLGRSEQSQLWVRAPRGPSATRPGQKSVVFSISGAGLPDQPTFNTLKVDAAGISLKSHIARRQCRDAFTRSTK